MSKNIDKIDEYLRGIMLPEHVSHQHQQHLRRDVLGEIERRQTMSVRIKSWKYAAVIALIFSGVVAAAVVGLKIHKYRYIDQDDAGRHRLLSEDGQSAVMLDATEADNPEQARKYAEEIAVLRQQGKRELVRVVDSAVNGEHERRVLVYKYTLSDGRTTTMNEGDPDEKPAWRLTEPQFGELQKLKQAGKAEDVGTEDKIVKDRVFSFKHQRFVLRDGTEVIRSVGEPKDDQ
jgi:hypothetical protein